MKIRELFGRLKDRFLPSQDQPNHTPRKVFTGKAHPSEVLRSPEIYTGHGDITRNYLYMAMGPNRKERRMMARAVADWHKGLTPAGVDPQKYHTRMKYYEWTLLNAPTNIPAVSKRTWNEAGKLIKYIQSNNPVYGR